ncbi:MAG: glycosyltransferase family 2 protein [Ferruginibacter sp.]|nr:glycosyltransferase family 2 protein [Ferruginibacter sp.]
MIIKEAQSAGQEIASTRVSDKGLYFSTEVSAVIITYNEEQNIRRTLSKLTWCDEIVVVDSFSSDNTVAICKEFGCKIFSRTFDGYGAQKQFAVSQATNDWILCIDADEVLADRLVTEIQKTLISNEEYAGYSMRMNFVFLDKEFRHGKESERFFLRLFNKQLGYLSNDKVHESICVAGPVKKLQHAIKHYSYTSLHQCLEKVNRYSTYSAEMAFSKGKNKSMLAILFGLPFNFFKYYLLELNCLNGRNGFYWAVFSSYYHFAKYVKLKELHRTPATQ